MSYKITATDEKISAALDNVGLPVFYGEVPEDQLNGYNFIYYKPSALRKNSINTYGQNVIVILVTKLSDLDKEMQIIEEMESIKMQAVGDAQYNRYQIGETTEFINVVAYTFVRTIKRMC